MLVWNDKMAGHQTASGQVCVNLAFTWCLLPCNRYQFCSSNVWALQHRSVHDFHISTIIVFVYLGLQFKWKPFGSNNYRHTSCIHVYIRGCMLGSGLTCCTPNQMPSVHWDNTGLHWDHTGWCHHPVVSPLPASGNLHNWNTLEDHWSYKYTEMPLEQHWLMLAPSAVPVTIQY